MDSSTKRKTIPSAVCQYKKNCYRKNPAHFEGFSHPHIEDIVKEGRQNDGDFKIPVEFELSRDDVIAQCEIVSKLFPHLFSLQPACKRPALSNSPGLSVEPIQPAPSKSPDLSVELIDSSPEKAASKTSSSKLSTPKQTKLSFKAVQIVDCSPKEGTSSKPSTPKQPEKIELIDSSPEKKSSPLNPNAATFTPRPSGSRLEAKKEMQRQAVRQTAARNVHQYFDVVAPKGQMMKKLEAAAPYNFFLTAITDSKPTHSQPETVTFMELLDESLGELESSVQINFMVDISWLMANYYFAGQE